MDDWGIAQVLFSAFFRLSLPKRQGRVRVSLRRDVLPFEPLTLSLSPLRKGRGVSSALGTFQLSSFYP
jgi:hypothetical protein